MIRQIPLLSVIMPVYNGEKYLSESIESILGQTLSEFEFIIIDDGSTDTSVDIIQAYAKKVLIHLQSLQEPHLQFQ